MPMFQSDAIFGIPPGLPSPNTNANPYAQGGPLFGQGYGDQRNVIFSPGPNAQASFDSSGNIAGYHYSPPPVIQYQTAQQPVVQRPASASMPSIDWSSLVPKATKPTPVTANPTQNIQTTVTPQPVFDPSSTIAATNQAVANAQQQANARWLAKPYDKPGISRSSADYALVAPSIANYMSQANLARQQLPLSDAATNAQNILRGQTGRDQEGLGLADVLAQFNAANMGYNTAQNANLIGLITSLLGGLGNTSGLTGSLSSLLG